VQPFESHQVTTTLDLKETSKLILRSRAQGRQRLLAVVDEEFAAVSAEIKRCGHASAQLPRTSSVCAGGKRTTVDLGPVSAAVEEGDVAGRVRRRA
jgi:hypothetical protein